MKSAKTFILTLQHHIHPPNKLVKEKNANTSTPVAFKSYITKRSNHVNPCKPISSIRLSIEKRTFGMATRSLVARPPMGGDESALEPRQQNQPIIDPHADQCFDLSKLFTHSRIRIS